MMGMNMMLLALFTILCMSTLHSLIINKSSTCNNKRISNKRLSSPFIRSSSSSSSTVLYGRAAAVRAATKAKTDGAKAKNNNRFAKKIIMVVKAGGSDPEKNRALAGVIADAKVANVPNDVIKRNIEKASAKDAADYKESLFEFVGPGGVGLLVNVLTDNDNRAASDVQLVGKKHNLKAGTKGSVSFNFNRRSKLSIADTIDEEKLMELCLDAGVDDYDLRTEVDGNPLNPPEEGKSIVYVDMKDMASIRDALRTAGYALETSIASIPKDGAIIISEEDLQANLIALDAFEALDDVDSIEHNIDMVNSGDQE